MCQPIPHKDLHAASPAIKHCNLSWLFKRERNPWKTEIGCSSSRPYTHGPFCLTSAKTRNVVSRLSRVSATTEDSANCWGTAGKKDTHSDQSANWFYRIASSLDSFSNQLEPWIAVLLSSRIPSSRCPSCFRRCSCSRKLLKCSVQDSKHRNCVCPLQSLLTQINEGKSSSSSLCHDRQSIGERIPEHRQVLYDSEVSDGFYDFQGLQKHLARLPKRVAETMLMFLYKRSTALKRPV